MSDCRAQLSATVTAIEGQYANINLQKPLAAQCAQCQQRGGCQSISIYQWFFAARPLRLPNQHYQPGQQLHVDFPLRFLPRAVGLLLGLPLAGFTVGALSSPIISEIGGFLFGVILAIGGFYVAKQHIRRHFQQQLGIQQSPASDNQKPH